MKNLFKANPRKRWVNAEVVEVTQQNLGDVRRWLGYSMGTSEVRDGRIYTHLYDDTQDGQIIDPGTHLVKLAPYTVIAVTASTFGLMRIKGEGK